MNVRSTLLKLAGGDAMPSAAISNLLSMRTGQGYAEFAVSSFGIDSAIGDPGLCRALGRLPLRQPGYDDLWRHLGGAAQHHRRASAGAAPRSVGQSVSGEGTRHSGAVELMTVLILLSGCVSADVVRRE